MADLSALLAELGGDNPQNRAIAEGLAKQGIKSTKDIGVKTESRPSGDFIDPDTGERSTAYAPQQVFYDKSSNKDINPTRLGIYDVKDGDKTQGNIFFHLNADDDGKVSFAPQWSPRAHGFLRDNAVGRLIMTAGKIIPSPFQAGFVAADVADKLAHGKVMQAVAAAIPYGIQELAKSAELLQTLSGNSEFVATAKTAAGKIAEAAGAPSYAADLAGKVATSGITAGLTGGNVGEAMLKAGANSLLGESKDFLKAAGDFSKMGIGGLLPDGISASDFDADALEDLGGALEEVDVSPADVSPNWEGKGWGEIGEGEFEDEIKPDLTARDNIEEGIGSLNNKDVVTNDGIGSLNPEYSLEGGAGSDYVSPEGEGMVDDAGDTTDKTDLGTKTIRRGWTSWEGDDNEPDIDPNAELTLPPGADPDETVGEEPYLLNPDDPYLPLELPPGADPDEVKPEEPYLLNDETITGGNTNDSITGGKGNDTLTGGKSNDSITGGGVNDIISTVGKLSPLIPAIFPPRTSGPVTRTVTPTVTGGGGNDTLTGGGRNDTLTGGGDGLTSITDGLLGKDPLTGGYSFSWNKQKTQGPEKGIAYGQKYYGNQWSKSDKTEPTKTEPPKTEPPKTDTSNKLVALPMPVQDPTEKEYWTLPANPSDEYATMPYKHTGSPLALPDSSQIQFAEGGLMTLGGAVQQPTFKPTMTDAGISSEHLAKNNVAGQAIQHMRKGGHVIDHKTHKDVHYLASKGEPVHHIVGFMNHRKRMAEGGITSTSLGSYSDGGHLLKGPGDGMSDDIPATIADKQPARLANEEFVIPADVVSHLGNGSSESGAKVLYEMMARIRKARTGNPKQGKQINPHKLMPKV
jgi:Ca2+-binding RTX toxin-like protein